LTIDADRIRSKLNDIGKSLKRLKAFQPLSREAFLQSEDNQDIARSRLLTGIEAALNVCYHLSAKKLNQVPGDYADCFIGLGRAGLIPQDLAYRLASMAKFRNRLVHLYWDIDYEQVHEMICNDLGDLESFMHEVGKLLVDE
jgi:uncharacterized protein YutE (UPF0331/DUF86 family)